MQGSLDMSLDDLIRNSKRPGGHNDNFRGRDRGRVSGSGPFRRFLSRTWVRTAPYSAGLVKQLPDSMLVPQMGLSGGSNPEAGTKLYLSNLDYGVSNKDIEVLFSDVGDLKQHAIHYDKSGRSKGTAEVVFLHHSDALAAIKRYNNLQLDGKPLKIELVGVNFVTPPALPPTGEGILGKPNSTFRGGYGHGKVGFRGSTRHAGGHGRARGPEWGSTRDEKVTAEDLDADLEKYRLEAMQIN